MAIDKKVNTRFTAKDGITKRFGVMARAAARFGRNAASSFRRVNRQASKFRGITSGFLKAQVIGKGFGLLTRGISSVVTSFIAFDKAALGATVRFKDIGPNAANFNEKLKEIEATARRVGSETEFTATQAAEGLDFLARAGFTAAEAMAALGSMVNLATATGEDFNSVADKSSDLLGAFGLNADNTAKKIENLNRLNDVLVKTANSTNVTIETMFDTMKRAAPVGRIVGASLEEVAAMVGILGNVGIKGTEAGTALTNMFLRLSAVTPATKKMLEDIRVEIDDGTGNMKKFSVLMKEISGATAEFGNIKVAKVLDTLFGKRAIAGAKNIGASIKELEDLEKALLNAGMTSQQTADVMRTSIEAKLLALGSAATEFGFKILNAFRTNGKAGIDALTEAVRDFDVKPVIEDLKIVLEVVKAIFKFAGLIAKAFFVVADTIAHS
ncbi:MAG: phage tail tape measure protein, partial [Desulfuromonadales bacterium]|nr:phage tail tape measure protein [Desulfuromonadales bacterium]